MKFNTETIQNIERLIIVHVAKQIEGRKITAGVLEQGVRNNLQEIGRTSHGRILSVLDQHQHGVETEFECGIKVKRLKAGWDMNYSRCFLSKCDCPTFQVLRGGRKENCGYNRRVLTRNGANPT